MKLTKFLAIILTIFLVSSCSQLTLTQENIWETFQTQAVQNNDIIAVMDTSKWQIKIKLFPNLVPNASYNFIGHALNDYYDNLTFHRVIDNFMIQGGDPKGNGTWWESIYGAAFQDEFVEELKNIPYSLSMANAGPNTNGSQFFINEKNNSNLDNLHTVFGQVVQWIDVVNAILETPVGELDKPNTDVLIKDINIYSYTDGSFVPYKNTLENIVKKVESINAIKAEEDAKKEAEEAKEAEKKAILDENRISKAWDIVQLKYKWYYDNKEVFDENFTKSSFFTVTIGKWEAVPGFDAALENMKIGEKKSIRLSPEEAYGWETVTLDKKLFVGFEENGIPLEAGSILPTRRGNIEIKSVTDSTITIINNHDKAGKTLNFDIELHSFIN